MVPRVNDWNLEFLRAAYGGCLNRAPDEPSLQTFRDQLAKGELTWSALLWGMVHSEEFRRGFIARLALEQLHEARGALFKQHLPKADIVVDLGGASTYAIDGALFAMGYPYTPRSLVIIDLPPENRFVKGALIEPGKPFVNDRGTEVRYLHSSMSRLDSFESGTVDMVVAGASIEHVSESEADAVIVEAYRVLRPGGHFCFDTCNAKLTRLESPHQLVHPEHQKEYLVDELVVKVTSAGFHIEKTLGMCPMPRSLASGHFDYYEMIGNGVVDENPDHSYEFFIHARKPAD
jgi:SAM-dependent methyltransferase